MGKVARQVVEQAGVNVDILLDKLVRAASAEFTTFYYYTILRVNSIGFDGEGLKEIIETCSTCWWKPSAAPSAPTPRICNMTFGKGGTSAAVRRASPHVRKFMTADIG